MGHGKKKWIVDYRGRIKRSRDRTKKDYFGELWQLASNYADIGKPFGKHCPQCKHNAKPLIVLDKEYRAKARAVIAEWEEKYGEMYEQHRPILNSWVLLRSSEPRPKYPDGYISLHEFMHLHGVGRMHFIREEEWMCPKHRHMFDSRDGMWRHYKGDYGQAERRRDEYRSYRAEMKSLMNKAKYDPEYYDDILADRKKGWLD